MSPAIAGVAEPIPQSTYCTCPLKGFCSRHRIQKSQREWELCRGLGEGLVPATEAKASKYRKAWDAAVGTTITKSPAIGGAVHVPIVRPHGERPGTELKKLFSWFGLHGSTTCGCANHAAEMDRKGCDWCEANMATIVGWLRDEAAKAKVLGVSADMVFGFEVAARSMIGHAIDNARAAKLVPTTIASPSPSHPLETSPIDDATVQRTLLYFIFPLGGESAWCWRRNIDQLAEHRHLFNAGIHFTVAHGEHKGQATESVREVTRYLISSGFANPLVRSVANNNRREAAHFAGMLKAAESLNPQSVFCVAHAKGVTHSDRASVVHRWTELMYETVLGNWDNARIALESYGTAGAFKRYGDFKTPGNHKWHYSGTFYWARSASVFARNWSKVDKPFFGMESWPGLHFRASEGACLFADNAGDLYKPGVLATIERQLAENGLPTIASPEQYRQAIAKWGIK